MENKDILNSLTHAGCDQYGSWALDEDSSAHIQNQAPPLTHLLLAKAHQKSFRIRLN